MLDFYEEIFETFFTDSWYVHECRIKSWYRGIKYQYFPSMYWLLYYPIYLFISHAMRILYTLQSQYFCYLQRIMSVNYRVFVYHSIIKFIPLLALGNYNNSSVLHKQHICINLSSSQDNQRSWSKLLNK